jgi:hypothetical protein
MRIFHHISIAVFLLLQACQSSEVKNKDYFTFMHPELGWEIDIPLEWKAETSATDNENKTLGKKALEKYSDKSINTDYERILSFEKNKNASFIATAEFFEETYEGEWLENNLSLKSLLFNAFSERGIKADTASATEMIDNIPFQVFHISIKGPDNQIIIHQSIYASLIKNHNFGVVINYLDENDRQDLHRVWSNSRFTKK